MPVKHSCVPDWPQAAAADEDEQGRVIQSATNWYMIYVRVPVPVCVRVLRECAPVCICVCARVCNAVFVCCEDSCELKQRQCSVGRTRPVLVSQPLC